MADDVGVNFGKNRTGDHDRTAAKSNARSAIERLAIPAFAVGVAIACVSLVAVDWNVWTVGRSSQSTDDAVISADVATVSAQVSGVLRRIGVDDYQSVKKGDLLAELDDREFVAAEDAARANLESANAAVANLSNQVELQKSVIKAAEAQNTSAIAQLDQTREEFNRQTSLGGATSQQMLQQAQAAYLQAKASVRATSSAIDQQRAQLKVLIGQYPVSKHLPMWPRHSWRPPLSRRATPASTRQTTESWANGFYTTAKSYLLDRLWCP